MTLKPIVRLKWVLCLAASLNMPAELHAASAGSTTGTAAVSPSGAGRYSIPIVVPMGIAGLQPQLSLEYDSQSGRGIAGPGWSLQGLPSIKRCPQTKRQDGQRRAISLTSADRFCLDGQRLVLDGTTTYGADGAVYRAEIDNFARVTSNGTKGAGATAGNGPTWFKVETKSGMTLEFGNSVDSRMVSGPIKSTDTQPTTVVMWSLSKMADRSGNTISYTYSSDASKGSQYLSRIDYNGGKAYIKFDYVDDSNPRQVFIAGTQASHPKLLSKIRSYVLDDTDVEALVKSYELSYDNTDIKGVTAAEKPIARLQTVTECGSDGGCLNPIRLNWQTAAKADASFNAVFKAGVGATVAGPAMNNEIIRFRRFADLNGDGKLDIVAFADDGVYVLLSKDGSGSSAYQSSAFKAISDYGDGIGWREPSSGSIRPRHLVDMNRDGYPDIVGINNLKGVGSDPGTPDTGVYLSLWDPTTKTFKSKTKLTGADFFTTDWGVDCTKYSDLGAPKYLVDMNDDGYPDLVGFSPSGVYVSYWDGAKFLAPAKVSDQFQMTIDGWLGASNQCYGIDIQPIFLEDMNGDGYPDIVGINLNGVHVALWNPTSAKFDTVLPIYTEIQAHPRGTTVPVYMADMNSDGYPDLLQFAWDGVRVALWNGKGFSTSSLWSTELLGEGSWDASRNPRRIADVNGDGYPDVISFQDDGVYVSLSNGRDAFAKKTLWIADFKSGTTDWAGAKVTPRHVLDIDGDGMPDIVGFGTSGVRWASPKPLPGPVLTEVVNASGATTNFSYTTVQDFAGSYASDPMPAWPVRNANGPSLVVSFLKQDNGVGGSAITRYRYGGRAVDFNDGPLGFRWMAVRDETTGIETYTEFEQSRPHLGSPKKTEIRKTSIADAPAAEGCSVVADKQLYPCMPRASVTPGTVLARSTNTQEKESLGNAGEYSSNTRYFLYTKQILDERFELDGSVLPSKTTTFEYEEPRLVSGSKQWGNLTKKRIDFGDSRSITVVNTYETAVESTWSLGRLSKSVVTSKSPARTVSVSAPSDAALPPSAAGPLPMSVESLISIVTSLLIDD